MRFWSDLSWMEKQEIEVGDVNPFDYLTDCSFQVKQKVEEGIEKKELEELK